MIGTRAALLPGRHTDSLRAWPCARPCWLERSAAARAQALLQANLNKTDRASKREEPTCHSRNRRPLSKPKLPPAFRAPCRPTTPFKPVSVSRYIQQA